MCAEEIKVRVFERMLSSSGFLNLITPVIQNGLGADVKAEDRFFQTLLSEVPGAEDHFWALDLHLEVKILTTSYDDLKEEARMRILRKIERNVSGGILPASTDQEQEEDGDDFCLSIFD
eukprot:jgi/Botrbrau1/22276/Bobra.0138s0031.2